MGKIADKEDGGSAVQNSAVEMGEADTTDRNRVTALERGLAILRCFTARDRGGLSNGEIAARTGLAKSTVSRLTYTLTTLGYLRWDEAAGTAGRYRVGPSVLALGYVALGNIGVREQARPLMQDLADYASALVSLATRDRLAMIYLENCRPRSLTTLKVSVGMQMPMASTSIGRAFLAALPAAERGFLMDQLARREGDAWAEQRAGLDKAFADVAARGYCVSIGEWQRDTNAVAAPLTCPDGEVLALSLSGPAFALTPQRIEEDLGPRLVYLARSIEAAAG